MDLSGSGDSSWPPQTPVGGGRGLPMGRRLPASISSGRLPTMRSRDLTLGGVKKKTFTPNIIVRKSKEELKTDERQRLDKKNADRGRQRNGRGRGRGRPEVIQSHSIFEQGPAEMMAKRKGIYDDTKETPNSGPSPIINIKKERETEEETKEILRKLERDKFLDDPHLRGERGSCPVQLPLAVSGWVFKEEFSEETKDIDFKSEKNSSDTEPMNTDSTGAEVKVKQEPLEVPKQKMVEPTFRLPPLPEPDLLPDLLEVWNHCKEEELLFIQLPDSLPGQPPTSDARPTKTEVQSSDGQAMLQKTETQEESQEENSCCLKDLQEGLVGKMLLRKSGKVQLILGNITLDVALGTPCAFLQELVSVNTEGRRGDMSVLGHIKHKLVCSPDFQSLLENRA
ncbi:DNA-directed RNA polymerase III subunit RPC4-like [Myxocyprinus asiaticus]|uniref:DNA-directed RNA polymerase III subunit RPC4-like n=1 Tax=Myxocyprinus asiaticus TaxID=70543 RepID=UPI002223E340|nr:DNA-directed RNA polymerase III subunit RPC4-like [Myxocyprinus asiaticus]XP_051524669.1 DNA-directed RNA polymerase III subunit RPC4-like [Myxocyprinus asiaticus]